MYRHPAFREDELAEIPLIIREARLSTLVTATQEQLTATPVSLLFDESRCVGSDVPGMGLHRTRHARDAGDDRRT